MMVELEADRDGVDVLSARVSIVRVVARSDQVDEDVAAIARLGADPLEGLSKLLEIACVGEEHPDLGFGLDRGGCRGLAEPPGEGSSSLRRDAIDGPRARTGSPSGRRCVT